MKFKSSTCSDYLPVKVWIESWYLGVSLQKERRKFWLFNNHSLFWKSKNHRKFSPCNTVPGTEQRKLQDMSFVLQEIIIWKHLFCLKESDLSDPGQSRSHTNISQAVNTWMKQKWVRQDLFYINRNGNLWRVGKFIFSPVLNTYKVQNNLLDFCSKSFHCSSPPLLLCFISQLSTAKINHRKWDKNTFV